MYTVEMSLGRGGLLDLNGLDFHVIIFRATLRQAVENVPHTKGPDVEPMILSGGSSGMNSFETSGGMKNVSRREKSTFAIQRQLAGCTEGGVEIH